VLAEKRKKNGKQKEEGSASDGAPLDRYELKFRRRERCSSAAPRRRATLKDAMTASSKALRGQNFKKPLVEMTRGKSSSRKTRN